MREIFRPEAVWREVIPLVVFAGVVIILYLIALMIDSADLQRADNATVWTMRIVGALIATVAAFGLFWRCLHGDPLDLQFGFVLALLAGLLLVQVHWSLAMALGAIGVTMVVKELVLRYRYPTALGTDADPRTPTDRPMV
jgi:hypothetical protein